AHAVRKPADAVGLRQHSGIAERRPYERARLVGEAGDRIPRGRRARPRRDAKPAVPRKILQLHGPEKDSRAKARLIVVADVLDALGVAIVDRLAPERVAKRDSLAAARDERHQTPLEIQALHR